MRSGPRSSRRPEYLCGAVPFVEVTSDKLKLRIVGAALSAATFALAAANAELSTGQTDESVIFARGRPGMPGAGEAADLPLAVPCAVKGRSAPGVVFDAAARNGSGDTERRAENLELREGEFVPTETSGR